ncbi:putative vacuolar protein-sorting-associated protein 25 protein [Eutypa lata UCREL1]|uniref:Vacuolar protein-sorting-associated protein 25 n=1 Tax=Eutypa lata (strain UCR-EL1) TaxID=1287681 RepID=M7T0Y0_EUTLA|nr:putative vacuolar protein-sorting-associated protein 25 protein [Eutypa lata UCREL1]
MQSATSTPTPGLTTTATAAPSSSSLSTATTTTTTTTLNPPKSSPNTNANNNNNNNNNNIPSTTTANPFEFPREYQFPPFFTRQPNATTRHSQLEKWSTLIQGWARHRRLFRVSVAEEELFHNRRLGRRLSPADAREVLEFMRREGRAEPVVGGRGSGGGGGMISSAFGVGDDLGLGEGEGGGGGSGAGAGGGTTNDVYWVYWKTPEEWAHDLEAWVEETAQKGVVFTLYELTEGEDTRGTDFYGLDPEVLQKALQVLVKRGKAQIFGQEDQQGVKFF